jgi:hypothetical protein
MASKPILSQQTRSIDKNGFKTGVPIYSNGLIKTGDEINLQAFQRSKRVSTTFFGLSHYNPASLNDDYVNPDGVGPISPVLNWISKSDLEATYNDILTVIEIPFKVSPTARYLSVELGYIAGAHQKHHSSHATEYFNSKIEVSMYSTFTRQLLDIGWKASIQSGDLSNCLTGCYYRNLEYVDVVGGIAPATVIVELPNVYDATPRVLNTGSLFLPPSDGISNLPPSGTLPADYSLYRSSPRPLFIPLAYRNTDICLTFSIDYLRFTHITIIESYEETVL